MSKAAPLMPGERIVTLDILRGFALLGILVMNLPDFAGTSYFGASDAEPAAIDTAVYHTREIFFSGKFNSLFSFLFGLGFTIQLGRLQEKEPGRAGGIYARRLTILLAIGIAHACLLWPGDVLHNYALLGFLLYALRGASDRTLYILIGVLLLVPGLRSLGLMAFSTPAFSEAMMAYREALEYGRNTAFGAGSFLEAARESTRQTIEAYSDLSHLSLTLSWYGVFMTTMLLGMLAGRHRIIQQPAAWRSLIVRLQWGGLALGITASIFAEVAARRISPGEPSMAWVAWRTLYAVARIALMIFYVAVIIRLCEAANWRRLLSPLAAAGRMPLTNYLLQTVICTAIFYGWGFGFWGKTTTSEQMLLALGIFFLIQVPLSIAWFRRFDFGPVEYLWRRLTYAGGSKSVIGS